MKRLGKLMTYMRTSSRLRQSQTAEGKAISQKTKTSSERYALMLAKFRKNSGFLFEDVVSGMLLENAFARRHAPATIWRAATRKPPLKPLTITLLMVLMAWQCRFVSMPRYLN